MYQSVAKNQIGFLDHVLKAKSAGPHVQQAVYWGATQGEPGDLHPSPRPIRVPALGLSFPSWRLRG